jgi:hypothetical protein
MSMGTRSSFPIEEISLLVDGYKGIFPVGMDMEKI